MLLESFGLLPSAISITSVYPSLSSSGSKASISPSPSVSRAVPGVRSVASPIPSPSVSGLFGSVPIMSSSASDKKSLSLSLGVLLESLGLEPP